MAKDAEPGRKLYLLMLQSEAEAKAGTLIDLDAICA